MAQAGEVEAQVRFDQQAAAQAGFDQAGEDLLAILEGKRDLGVDPKSGQILLKPSGK